MQMNLARNRSYVLLIVVFLSLLFIEKSYAVPASPFVHRLDLDGDFLRFLRLSARLEKMSTKEASKVKDQVDRRISRM